MQNITGFGTVVQLVASKTFPAGITVTQFADDSDPLDMASIKIGNGEMGVNGDLVTWARAVSNPAVLNVIPGGPDDVNLAILFNNNMASQGKPSAGDVITMTVIYPNGTVVTKTGGICTDFMPGKSVSSAGRLKTRPYAFLFQTTVGN